MKATSFATRQDLAAFARRAAQFLTRSQLDECLSVGDQGIGAWGDATWHTTGQPMCALPHPWQHNERVRVTIPQLGSVECLVMDRAPTGVVDLNPAALFALCLPPDEDIEYDGAIVEDIPATSGPTPAQT